MKSTCRTLALLLWTATAVVGAAQAEAGTVDKAGRDGPRGQLTPQQVMLWKYTARCALRADQELEAPAGPSGEKLKFKGSLGLGPEWREGKCDDACQEKVSSCLAALTNQTGDHVQLSLLSAAASLAPLMSANENDLAYPFQEGAFFGNVFAGEAYVCRGRDAEKGAQLKRLCALAPGLCSGIAKFSDAGSCEQSCDMSCTRLSDGSARCAAVRCRDPKGKVWNHPITTYLRDRIEAGNADVISGAESRDSGLEQLHDGGWAIYRHVDFGRRPGGVRTVVASVRAAESGGHIEVWLDGGRRLAVLQVRSTGGAVKDLAAASEARGLSGQHDLLLTFSGLHADARLADIALR